MGERSIPRLRVASVALLALLVGGTAAAEEIVVFDNNNADAVQNGPRQATRFRVRTKTRLTHIRVYHYNGGRGAPPGRIRIDDARGQSSYGFWKTRGVAMRPGGGALYWECTPELELEPDHYVLVVSSPATWSCNARSGYAGIATIRGTPLRAVPPPPPPAVPPPSAPAPSPPPNDGTFGMELLAPAARDAQGRPLEAGRCYLTLPHAPAEAPGVVSVGTLALPDEARDPTHVIGGWTELGFPRVRLVNGTARPYRCGLRVTLRHDETGRESLLAARPPVSVPASGEEAVEVTLPMRVALLDHLGIGPSTPASYTIRFEAVEVDGLSAAILDHSIRLRPFRLDRAEAVLGSDGAAITMRGPALRARGVTAQVVLPSGETVDTDELAEEDAAAFEVTAEGVGRLRVPAELLPAYVRLCTRAGLPSNRVHVAP